MARTLDEQIDASIARKVAADLRAYERWCKKADKAEQMVGELCRNGATVYYIFPVGGKYREGPRHELVDFLVRNGYAQ